MSSNGWDRSAAAWIADMGAHGDFARRHVLDRPMLARTLAAAPERVLDIGCGEGRFCRLLREEGIATLGIDPTEKLIEVARQRDPEGDYRRGSAERLDLPDASFDLALSYLTLIDIDDLDRAIAEAARVLRPGGHLLIANLNPFNTAGSWRPDGGGGISFRLDNYLEERAEWVAWRGIRIRNWHRPMERYMRALLAAGLTLRHFEEPRAQGGDPDKAARYDRVPYFHIMDWQKPL